MNMNEKLQEVIRSFTLDYQNDILSDSRYYQEVSIGRQAGKIGYPDVEKTYRNVYAVIPLRSVRKGMKVRIDGRTFVDYAQFASGVAVPGYVARKMKVPFQKYIPHDSMILNF